MYYEKKVFQKKVTNDGILMKIKNKEMLFKNLKNQLRKCLM